MGARRKLYNQINKSMKIPSYKRTSTNNFVLKSPPTLLQIQNAPILGSVDKMPKLKTVTVRKKDVEGELEYGFIFNHKRREYFRNGISLMTFLRNLAKEGGSKVSITSPKYQTT